MAVRYSLFLFFSELFFELVGGFLFRRRNFVSTVLHYLYVECSGRNCLKSCFGNPLLSNGVGRVSVPSASWCVVCEFLLCNRG